MEYLEEWEKEEFDFVPEDWTEEDEALWNKVLPYVKENLFVSEIEEIKIIEAQISEMPYIEPSNDFKVKMNKLFRDNFGENCKIPHPEVEQKRQLMHSKT